jgi:hypothetical protein
MPLFFSCGLFPDCGRIDKKTNNKEQENKSPPLDSLALYSALVKIRFKLLLIKKFKKELSSDFNKFSCILSAF